VTGPSVRYRRPELEGVPHLERIVEGAKRRILRSSSGSADAYVDRVLSCLGLYTGNDWPDVRLRNAILRRALEEAQQDPMYHGVEDPAAERYCSTCHKVRPIEAFVTSESTCERCRKRYSK
jgi:hypothetical protein